VRAVSEATVVARVSEEVSAWVGVSEMPHRFGGLEFRLNRRKIGLLFEGRRVDIPFPRHIREGLVSSSAAYVSDSVPASGWVTFPIGTDDDVQHAISLLRLSYACVIAQRRRSASRM
jgi:hypothetical protein